MKAPRDFEKEARALRRRVDGKEGWKAVYGLEDLEEDWARSLVRAGSAGSLEAAMRRAAQAGLEPRLALEVARHLAEAERWQAQIGTYATGSGEGFVSMMRLRRIQLARLWALWSARADAAALREGRALYANLDTPGAREDLAPYGRRDLRALKAAFAGRRWK